AGGKAEGGGGRERFAALRRPPPTVPLPLAWPLTRPVLGDPFGPRGVRWHSGVDFPAPLGTSVYASRGGEVVWSGWRDGYGLLVTVAHGHGERTMYAHLSRIDVRVGVWIGQGVRVGLIGATGDATGPHLHFEVRIRGAAVNPLRALRQENVTSARRSRAAPPAPAGRPRPSAAHRKRPFVTTASVRPSHA